MEQEIFKKFSGNLKKVLIEAEKMAKDQGQAMDTDHQLFALLNFKENLAAEILAGFAVTPEKVKLTSAFLIFKKEPVKENLTPGAKEAIQTAVRIASEFGHSSVDCEHLLFALLSNKNFNTYKIIEKLGLKPEAVLQQIKNIFSNLKFSDNPGNNHPFDMDGGFEPEDLDFENPMMRPISPINPTLAKTKNESILALFAKNMTEMARKNQLDPVIGRENETERLIQILSRRTKNNPILVGEPGVGKTSIVEGLAQRIISGKVPLDLLNHEIMSLDMGSLIAGTMYRGQFESRIKKILSEIKKRRNIILFIDEIHTVVGAGSTEGSIDAANLLKPVLSRGELRLIGSTTFDEYKKHIEKDPAFERRLQPVKISEPTILETVKILKGIKTKYEKHHDVRYTDKALVAAANLAKRYINDRFLPDKAIDLIDEAAASTRTISTAALKMTELKKELREILKHKDDLIIAEKYKEATLLREREMKIEEEIEQICKDDKSRKIKIIDDSDIAHQVSRWTGIPVSNLTLEERKRYLDLEKRIKRLIIGQDQAVNEITKAIKRARVGISNPNRPVGSFIFLGPTGVGKTLLAKIIAKEVLGSEKALIKIDMSEFMEKHNISRLIGAPAGYIGYEEGGKLTEIVRKNPYSVILLDEIEKAHPEVFNILLQILEDGELTDAKGRHVDFKNTIVIMTSNLGTDVLTRQAAIGFGKTDDLDQNYKKLESNVLEAVNKHFKPEFINRIDKIIVFKPLDKTEILKITELELAELKQRLAQTRYKISFSVSLKKFIAEKGFDPDFGARPIRKAIADYIETPLSDKILLEEFKSGDNIFTDVNKDSIISFKKAS